MTDRRTIPNRTIQNVIIRSPVPGMQGSNFSFQGGNSLPQNQYHDDQYGDKFYDQRPIREITEENRNLRELIKRIQQKNQYQPQKKQYRQQGSNLQNRIDFNARKIGQLTEIVDQQRKVIDTYKRQLQQFERNLTGIMKLDKDIHSKLVNPHTSSTLEKNVKNVLIALNSKAPYDKLIKMIDNIKV